MPTSHDIGRTYWYTMKYPDPRLREVRQPLTESTQFHETDPPFRTGRGRAYRLPGTRWALVLGRWGRRQLDVDEEAHLHAANRGRVLEVGSQEIAQW